MAAARAVYAATPELAVTGEPSGLLAALLESLVVRETTDGLYSCEASFQNLGPSDGQVDHVLFDRSVVDFGDPFSVAVGAGDGAGTVFDGHVTGVVADFPAGAVASVTFLAEDRMQDLRMVRRTRAFEDVTDADVFRLVAADHGLRAEVDVRGPTHRVVAQVDQSDLAFLRERARRLGAELWVDGDVLHAARRADRRGTGPVLSFRQNLREARLSADLAHQRTSVAVGGWDPTAKQAIDVTAGPTALSAERTGTGKLGAELLEQAFGARPDRVVHLVPASTAEAQDIADARFAAMARRFVAGEVLTEGDARIRVGARVELVGVGAWFSGRYDVVEVEHRFDLRQGLRTWAAVERAELAL